MVADFPVPTTSVIHVNEVISEVVRGYIESSVYNDIQAMAKANNRPPDYDFDFRFAMVQKVVDHGFATDFLPVEPVVEAVYKRNNFRAKQDKIVTDLLNKGEFLLRVSLMDDTIGIQLINPTYLRNIIVDEKTDEVLMITLQYLYKPTWTDSLLIFRKTWTPTEVWLWNPAEDEEDLTIKAIIPNQLGVVPFAYQKWGNAERGVPVWWEVAPLIEKFNDKMCEIDDILTRNSEPTRVFETDTRPEGVKVGTGDGVWIEKGGKIYYLLWDGSLDGYWKQIEELIQGIAEISAIPVFRKPVTAPDASGEALKERNKFFDAKTRRVRKKFASGIQYLNKLIFSLMTIQLPQLVSLALPNGEPKTREELQYILNTTAVQTNAKMLRTQNKEQAEEDAVALESMEPIPQIDVASIEVEPVQFPPLRQPSGDEVARYAEATSKWVELKIISIEEARNVLRGLGVFEEYQ